VKSLLLMSLVLASIAIPARAARDPSARRGLTRTLVGLFVAAALWLGYITLVHPFAFVPHWP
jgi:hypothetical protein